MQLSRERGLVSIFCSVNNADLIGLYLVALYHTPVSKALGYGTGYGSCEEQLPNEVWFPVFSCEAYTSSDLEIIL